MAVNPTTNGAEKRPKIKVYRCTLKGLQADFGVSDSETGAELLKLGITLG